MKHLLFNFLLVFILISQTHAQERYQDSIFSEVVKITEVFAVKGEEELKMDVYFPENDTEKKRPLLLYVHGGGFSGGKRDSERYNKFAEMMTYKGYVNATIDYTLTMKGKSFGCDQPASNKINTFLQAGYDLSRATQYFIQNASRFGIDTNKIVILGSSAGAETVIHAAYWNAVKEDGEEKFLSEEFKYAGVISMAGAISTLDIITKENAIPTQLFHGTCDNLVPYATAAHHYCPLESPGFLILNGSYSIYNHLVKLGKPCYLQTACNGGHEWAGEPLTVNIDEITDFVFYDVLHVSKRQIHIIIGTEKEPCEAYDAYNFCE